MRGKQGDKARLLHIYEAIQELESYLKDKDYTDFLTNSMFRFACIKQLEIIGEAANHLTEQIKSESPEIEWSQVVGMRNVFVHQYFGIDSGLVWDILIHDIPDMKMKIITILDSIRDADSYSS